MRRSGMSALWMVVASLMAGSAAQAAVSNGNIVNDGSRWTATPTLPLSPPAGLAPAAPPVAAPKAPAVTKAAPLPAAPVAPVITAPAAPKAALVASKARAAVAPSAPAVQHAPSAPPAPREAQNTANGREWSRTQPVNSAYGRYARAERGAYIPRSFVSPTYTVNDWRGYNLPAPPRGYRWVRYYDDAVLVDNDGLVRDSINNVNWGDAAYAAAVPGEGRWSRDRDGRYAADREIRVNGINWDRYKSGPVPVYVGDEEYWSGDRYSDRYGSYHDGYDDWADYDDGYSRTYYGHGGGSTIIIQSAPVTTTTTTTTTEYVTSSVAKKKYVRPVRKAVKAKARPKAKPQCVCCVCY